MVSQNNGRESTVDGNRFLIQTTNTPPTPNREDTLKILKHIEWEHRFNTLIQKREWRKSEGKWQRTNSMLESRIRAEIRDQAPSIDDPSLRGPSQSASMQQVWGEMVGALDSYPRQHHDPLSDVDCSGEPLPLGHDILPWFDLMQRRANNGSDGVGQPPTTILVGTPLMPPELAQYTSDLFEQVPLRLVRTRAKKDAMEAKYHGRNKKVLVYTTSNPALANPIVAPGPGLVAGIVWAEEFPSLQLPEFGRIDSGRMISELAIGISKQIVRFGGGKSINEYLVALGYYDNTEQATADTRQGASNTLLNDIAYCLREWHGWDNKRQGGTRVTRWFAPQDD